jgi:hypothetical protein
MVEKRRQKDRKEILILTIFSCWISCCGVAAFPTQGNCDDFNTIGCIPRNVQESFGTPAGRSVVNSRFRKKLAKIFKNQINLKTKLFCSTRANKQSTNTARIFIFFALL